MKICNSCFNLLDDDKFDIQRNTCRKCRKAIEWLSLKQSPSRLALKQEYYKNYRKNHPEKYILFDSKKSDKRKNRQNDLDIEFITDLISQPCFYCGESKLKITLDRKDSSIGHLKSNVVPACIRCNYTKRDMPYEAWLFLIEGMRKAREMGVFGNWTGSVWK